MKSLLIKHVIIFYNMINFYWFMYPVELATLNTNTKMLYTLNIKQLKHHQ